MIAADGLGTPPVTPIMALPPMEVLSPALPIDPMTNEPPHVFPVRLAYAFLLAAAACQCFGMGMAWWHAIHMETFDRAVRLLSWTKPTPGSLASIFLVVAMMGIGSVLTAAPAAAGYLGWVGRPVAPKLAVVALVLCVLLYLVTPPNWASIATVAWLAVPLTLAGTSLLWLPASRRSLDAWQTFRNPAPVRTPERPIVYGRLEHFR